MKTSGTINRRRFLQTGLVGSTVLASVTSPGTLLAAVTKTERDPFHGLKVGLTTYTFHKFPFDEAIAMTKQAGVKYISIKDVHLPLKSTREQRLDARKKIEDAGLILMGGGVIDIKGKPEDMRNVFEYAKDLGMATIVCTAEPSDLEAIEKLVKEYDLRIAIHNHGPGDKRFPSPFDVLRAVKQLDARMGLCIDVGHTVRIGVDPIDAIEQCASRLYEFHMKDVNEATPKGKPVPVSKGVIDIVGVLKALLKLQWPYHVALEYEANADAPMPGVLESFAYMRGVLAAI